MPNTGRKEMLDFSVLRETQRCKEIAIKQILENPVYTEESGICAWLKLRLLALSKDDLESLALIISLKKA